MTVLLAGFLLGLSLIVAIGPQNAYIIKMGIKRQHVLPIILACFLSDVILIFAGVGGVGVLVERFPLGLKVIKYLGAAYLIYFAFTCFRDALKKDQEALVVESTEPTAQSADIAHSSDAASMPDSPVTQGLADAAVAGSVATLTRTRTAPAWTKAVLGALALTWLNPLAYVDVLVMLGGIANQYGPQRWTFALGALCASAVWFPTVGFGASRLSHVLARPNSWRVINAVIGCVMLGLTVKLLMH